MKQSVSKQIVDSRKSSESTGSIGSDRPKSQSVNIWIHFKEDNMANYADLMLANCISSPPQKKTLQESRLQSWEGRCFCSQRGSCCLNRDVLIRQTLSKMERGKGVGACVCGGGGDTPLPPEWQKLESNFWMDDERYKKNVTKSSSWSSRRLSFWVSAEREAATSSLRRLTHASRLVCPASNRGVPIDVVTR